MKSTAIQGAANLLAAASKVQRDVQDKVQKVDFSAVISQAGIQNQEIFQDGKAKPEEKNFTVKETQAVKKAEQKETDFTKAEKYPEADAPKMQPEEETAPAMESQKMSEQDVARDFEDFPEETVSKVAGFLDKLKEAFAKELSITEEELLAAMETLGFTVADFVDPDTVNTCIRSLCGAESVTELLVDEQLYVTYSHIQSDIMDLTTEFNPGNNLSLEELQTLMLKLEELQEAGVEVEMFEAPLEDAGLNENLPKDTVLEMPADGTSLPERPVETVRTAQETITTPLAVNRDKAEPEIQDRKEETEEVKAETELKPVSENLQQMEQNTDTTQQNLLGNHNQPEMQTMEPRVENAFQPETPYASFTNYDGSYESIIRQVAEQVRVQVTENVSTMEMHLNPESLGKLSLSVELKQGMMTARFVAENEQVKEAIESQAALLRDDLDKQGVKVEAIEVAVETHEFERNLEQGQQQSQAEEEARNAENERSRSRRNLNLDVLEEEEDLTEAEDLAAKIMKENGNTMDYFA